MTLLPPHQTPGGGDIVIAEKVCNHPFESPEGMTLLEQTNDGIAPPNPRRGWNYY